MQAVKSARRLGYGVAGAAASAAQAFSVLESAVPRQPEDHLTDVSGLFDGESSGERASACDELDQPLTGERLQRLADGRSADAELLGRLHLVEALASRELARQDAFPEDAGEVVREASDLESALAADRHEVLSPARCGPSEPSSRPRLARGRV